MQNTSKVDWKKLKPLVADNVALKCKILSLCQLPLHQVARKCTHKEITILLQTGCITNRIVLQVESGRLDHLGGAARFLISLLKREIISQDAKLLIYFVDRPPLLKPIFYELKETLDYLCSHRLVSPDVTDSEGCPVLLDSWRDEEHFCLLRQHKLLLLGAEALGTTAEGENILHLLARGKFRVLMDVLKYFPKRANLEKLVSRPDKEGYQPIHRLHNSTQLDQTIISFFLGLGADVNARIAPRGITLLHLFVITPTTDKVISLFTPGLRIIPDFSGVTALDLALHHGRSATAQFIIDNVCMGVKDVMSRHVIVMPRSSQLSQFDPKTHRAILLLRTKHGLACNEIQLPANLHALRPATVVDRGIKLTMDNVKIFSDTSSPWFLEFYTTQMESLLINFVNQTLAPTTLSYFLHCYLDALNSDFNIRTNNKSCDFNFQLSKHLTRIVRAIGHLRTVGSVDKFMDKFILFLSNKLLPLIDHKIRPRDINAVREGYISHFIQDVIFQINLVFSIWHFQTNTGPGREEAKRQIEGVWCRLRKSPNVELSILGNCVAAIVAWRVMICAEIKLDPISILHFFKEMGADVNERSGPDNLTPLAWIVTYDSGKKFSRNLLKELYKLGGYIYACDSQGMDVITIAAHKSPIQFYREWGEFHKQSPKPLKTVCAQCIMTHQIPLQSLSKSHLLLKFIRLHDLGDHVLYVIKSGQICVSQRQQFYV